MKPAAEEEAEQQGKVRGHRLKVEASVTRKRRLRPKLVQRNLFSCPPVGSCVSISISIAAGWRRPVLWCWTSAGGAADSVFAVAAPPEADADG